MISRSIEKLLAEAVAIEEEAAKEAGALGFMARAMVQATMPHRDPKTNEFERRNGNFTLTMLAPSRIGLPYGSTPRLLMSWLSTEAVRTRERTVVLGDTLSEFMRSLGMTPTGGRWGTITGLKNQARRLFSTSITCVYDEPGSTTGKNFQIADEYHLWWQPKEPDQAGLWQSTVTLNPTFYEELIKSPVPIDIRALKALKRSPMAIDVYCWLTYRMSYLKTPTVIPWQLLQGQFGADITRKRAFKEKFLEALQKVVVIYPEARLEPTQNGLMLKPSPLHIAR